METVKRVYAKPTILKVQLSHEQAVLSKCSATGNSLSAITGTLACISGGCRKKTSSSGGGVDMYGGS
jgi:hypothetical protein